MENFSDIQSEKEPFKESKTSSQDKDDDYKPKLFIEESIQLEDELQDPQVNDLQSSFLNRKIMKRKISKFLRS